MCSRWSHLYPWLLLLLVCWWLLNLSPQFRCSFLNNSSQMSQSISNLTGTNANSISLHYSCLLLHTFQPNLLLLPYFPPLWGAPAYNQEATLSECHSYHVPGMSPFHVLSPMPPIVLPLLKVSPPHFLPEILVISPLVPYLHSMIIFSHDLMLYTGSH